ncbi:MAG: methylated-DNA--[protein]-cysteine S-methyltransferase [Deltaproteobacteria bacterium]|nr:methylated-DNA--[protein]-cysteine S-methyltransferase [Deltaproteobacteria bacterium]
MLATVTDDPEDLGYAFFPTTLGRCALVFSRHRIHGIDLPERTLRDARARVKARAPSAKERPPSALAEEAIGHIVAVLSADDETDAARRRNAAVALRAIPLDLRGLPSFHVKVYAYARSIPPGETRSYKEIAEALGSPGAARAVGQALARNPFPIVVPCHRVLGHRQTIGGFSAPGGVNTKRKMLEIEQATVTQTPAPAKPTTIPRTAEPRRAAAPKRAAPTTRTARTASAPKDHGFAYNPNEAIRHLRAQDPVIRRVIDEVGPFTLTRNRTDSVFMALAEAIVYQQLTGKAAATIFGRVKALFPKKPTPSALLLCPDASLRAAGLSAAKTLALKDLADKTASGALPTLAKIERMDDEDIIEKLTTVRGIGRWTVEMFLIFRLGRPDVLPLDDFGVRKGFALMTGAAEMPSKKTLAAHGARWAPYRSVASFYAWRAVDRARTVAAEAKTTR